MVTTPVNLREVLALHEPATSRQHSCRPVDKIQRFPDEWSGDWKVAPTCRLESLRYKTVPASTRDLMLVEAFHGPTIPVKVARLTEALDGLRCRLRSGH
jgi:hypothetical protein